jgi:hypothetical protein
MSLFLVLARSDKFMIDIKRAVKEAMDYLASLYENPRSVQLEEVYLSDDEASWLVTLSLLTEADEEEILTGTYGVLAQALRGVESKRLVRRYKTFEVNRDTGEVRSMKIRPVPSV